jgi:hypothetical protein
MSISSSVSMCSLTKLMGTANSDFTPERPSSLHVVCGERHTSCRKPLQRQHYPQPRGLPKRLLRGLLQSRTASYTRAHLMLSSV